MSATDAPRRPPRRTRLVAVLLVTACCTLAGVVTTSPAQAATSRAGLAAALASCDNATDYDYGAYFYLKPTVGNDTGNTNCVLGRGNQGTGVFWLQQALWRCYGQNIARDGIFGPATQQAVRNAQRFHRIAVDGVFGPQTSRAMAWPKYVEEGGSYAGCWF